MSNKNTIYYKQKQEFILDFSAEEISTDTPIFLAEKIERKHGLIKHIGKFIDDTREKHKGSSQ